MGQPDSQTGGHPTSDAQVRLIARLDIKGSNLIKGIHLEGLRRVGSPVDFALKYYEEGIDELLFMDVVASLYGRSQLLEIVQATARNVFVPLTVGGGVRSVENFEDLLRNGADKVALNTAAINHPPLLSQLASRFGSQAVVVSVEAQQIAPGRWEALTDNGRERTGRDVLEWVVQATQMGAGEVLVTSVDREGTRSRFDTDLVSRVTTLVRTPVIASGGMGSAVDFVHLTQTADVSGIAMADVLHFKRLSISEIRRVASAAGVRVRDYE